MMDVRDLVEETTRLHKSIVASSGGGGGGGAEGLGLDALPRELWDHALSFLPRPRHIVRASLVCKDFHDLIRTNTTLMQIMTLPRFSVEESKGILIREQNRVAHFEGSNFKGFPNTKANTAWVTFKDHNSQPSTRSIVHFLMDCQPSTYFCVSVSTPLPKEDPASPSPPANTDLPYSGLLGYWLPTSYFIASYYNDGDIHSYGCHAPYTDPQSSAIFNKGDVISVQIGLRDVSNSQPASPEWAKVIDISTVRSSDNSGPKHTVHPYAIFYRNYKMIHQPLIFPHLDASNWPLRVGVFFTAPSEVVHITVPPEDAQFKPIPSPCSTSL